VNFTSESAPLQTFLGVKFNNGTPFSLPLEKENWHIFFNMSRNFAAIAPRQDLPAFRNCDEKTIYY
jgi:hypothetical protein